MIEEIRPQPCVILVAGSRTFANSEEYVTDKLDEYYKFFVRKEQHLSKEDIVVMSGGAPGVDTIAISWAKQKGYKFVVVPAQWHKHGKRAGYLRNKQMVEACDYAIIIWDGVSRGTRLTIDLLKQNGKYFRLYDDVDMR